MYIIAKQFGLCSGVSSQGLSSFIVIFEILSTVSGIHYSIPAVLPFSGFQLSSLYCGHNVDSSGFTLTPNDYQ